MSKKDEECRYIFTVRQQFGKPPAVDSFYKLTVPPGITGDQAKIMTQLSKDWCADEMRADTEAINGMQMRLRFNSDMYQKVCLVRTPFEITAETLDDIVSMKNLEGKLMDFLADSAI